MSDELRRNAAILKATLDALTILEPLSPDDRMTVLMGVVKFGGIREVVIAEIARVSIPDISELLEKVKPKPTNG
jgi:hypothetical protein